jgi:molybdopterin-binding protein
MKLSARNQLHAKIRSVTHGAVNTEVVLELRGGEELVAIVTRHSAEALGLVAGRDAVAVIKASSVMVATD